MARVDPSIAAPGRLLRLLIYYGIFLLPFFFFFSSSVDASVHSYVGGKFAPKGNAFVLHGGSQGLYASLPDPNATAGPGDAIIWHPSFDQLFLSSVESFCFHSFSRKTPLPAKDRYFHGSIEDSGIVATV